MRPCINYPKQVSWKLDLSSFVSANDCFSTDTRKKIKKTLSLLKDAGYYWDISPIDASYAELFYPIYKQHIIQKDHPVIIDIPHRLRLAENEGKNSHAISLYNSKKQYIGGIIFTYKNAESIISIAFRVFPKQIELKLPIGLSISADYLLYKYAKEQQIHTLFHGKDKNGYGLQSSIGLALFKFQTACRPFISGTKPPGIYQRELYDLKGSSLAFISSKDDTLHPDPVINYDITQSNIGVLYFLGTNSGEYINNAILYIPKEQEEILKKKYELLYKQPFVQIETILY